MRFVVLFIALFSTAIASDFYSIKDKTIKGEEFKASSLKGKTVLVVNIASQRGFNLI